MEMVKVNDHEVMALFDGLITKGQKPPLDAIGQLFDKSVKQNFSENGRPDKWPERADSTRSWNSRLTPQSAAFGIERDVKGRFRASKKGDWPLLRKTGRMFASMHYETYEGDGQYSVVYGDDTDYGIWHNIGTKKMPKRQFLIIQETDYKEIESILSTMFV